MAEYRLFMQPSYGEIAPEVRIPDPEVLDFSNPTVSRTKLMAEIYAGIVMEMKVTACYDSIMTVPAEDVFVEVRDHSTNRVRIYHPDGDGLHPVLYFIHGGGWTCNNLEIYDYVCRYLCKYSGAVVFSEEYRLAPEYKCPIGREDTYDVLQWVADHAGEYGGDADNISVCGDSAGGNLTAALTLMTRDRKGPVIKKQMMVYPATTFILDQPTYSMERYGRGGYFLDYCDAVSPLNSIYFTDPEDAKHPYNSPLLSDDLHGVPDAYFYSAACDPLLDQGLMYAAKLEDAGVNVSYHVYEGMIHGFLNRSLQKSFQCLQDICDDIRS